MTFEYTVHFQKGTRVGTRSLRMVHVNADTHLDAMLLAAAKFEEDYGGEARQMGYRMTRVDYFNENTQRYEVVA